MKFGVGVWIFNILYENNSKKLFLLVKYSKYTSKVLLLLILIEKLFIKN